MLVRIIPLLLDLCRASSAWWVLDNRRERAGSSGIPVDPPVLQSSRGELRRQGVIRGDAFRYGQVSSCYIRRSIDSLLRRITLPPL